MFSIEPLNSTPENIEGLSYSRHLITIEDHLEEILIPISFWSVEDYRQQWITSVKNLLGAGNKVILITEMYDPAYANFEKGFVLYKKQSEVVVQEHIIFLEEIAGPYTVENITNNLPSHSNVTEDGDQISEWVINMSDLEEFISTI